MTLPVRTSAEVFPVQPDADVAAILGRLLTGEWDGHQAVLREALQAGDRARLAARMTAISLHVKAAHPKDIAKAVVEMLACFTISGGGENEAKVKTTAYVKALLGLPLWAILRASGRFARGEVDADEVDAKALDRSFPPSTAQVRIVAERIAAPVYDEQRRIAYVLHGIPRQPELTAGQRQRMAERLQELGIQLRKVADGHRKADDEAAQAEADRIGRVMLDASAKMREREYKAAGIEPSETMSLGLRKLLQKGDEHERLPE